MKRFKRILALCPDDDTRENLLKWCKTISERAEPDLIEILRFPEESFLAEYPGNIDEKEFISQELALLEEQARVPLACEPVRCMIKTGPPLQTILNLLSGGIYDLVIIPTSDRESKSFAERIARKSPSGVLIVPQGRKPHFQKVLASIDFSELSDLTLDWAIAFSGLSKKDPNLRAIHATKVPTTNRATLILQPDLLKTAINQTAEKSLKDLLYQKNPNLTWKTSIVSNPIASSAILQEAAKQDTDLIVMGSHGRNLISVALLGGETTEIVRHSKHPVLVVKRKNESLGFLRNLLGLSTENEKAA